MLSTSSVKHSHHSHMCTRTAPSLQSPPPRHTLRNKQIYTYGGTSWVGILPAVRSRSVHLKWLLWRWRSSKMQPLWLPVQMCWCGLQTMLIGQLKPDLWIMSPTLSWLFSVVAPQWWKEPPTNVRTVESLSIFRKRLKTDLFRLHLDPA